MRNLGFGMVVCALACGRVAAPPADETAVAEVEGPSEPAPAGPVVITAPAPREAPAGPAAPDERPACSASIGLDLRALPTNAGTGGINMFVLGQGQRIRELTPPGVEVEIRHVPGWGSLIPVFRAATADEAEAVCRAVIAEYLEHAPRLPVIMESAASLVEPCHPWSAPPGAAPPAD